MDPEALSAYLEDMAQDWFLPLLITAATVGLMELFAFAIHKYVMHGFGWGWHRSHHEPRLGYFEKNDLYALLFGGISLWLFIAGTYVPLLWWVGAGTALYGILYALVHDGLVHRRFPFLKVPRAGYLKRLAQAHRLHHAAERRTGAVSFGFLYARPVPKLKRELQRLQSEASG